MGRVRKYKKRKTLPKRDDDIHSLRGELVDEPIASLEKEDSRLSRSMRNFLQSKKQAARFEERQREKKREKRRRSETGGDNEQDTRGKKRRSGDGIRQESARNEKEIEGKEEEAIPEQFEGESIQAYTRRLNEHTKNKLRKIEAQHHAMRPSRKAHLKRRAEKKKSKNNKGSGSHKQILDTSYEQIAFGEVAMAPPKMRSKPRMKIH